MLCVIYMSCSQYKVQIFYSGLTIRDQPSLMAGEIKCQQSQVRMSM